MAESIEERAAQPFDLERVMDLVRRRHVPFLILLFAGWCAVWGASWILPARYKSTTLILVEQPTVPKNYVTPNVTDDLQDRLQSITQQMLSRTRLLLIIDKLRLYKDAELRGTPDERVAQMRKDIDIELVRNPQDQINAFSVSYSAHDPRVAQRVTSELTNLFINENLKTREEASEDTTAFLQEQLDNARKSLSEQEAKVRQFETEHQGSLPSQQASNLQILSGLQSQLQNEQDSLNTAEQQRVYFQALIEQNRAAPQAVRTNGTTQASPLSQIDQQLAALKAKLVDLRSRYTDRYPDVVALKEQIAETQRTRERLLAEAKRVSNGRKQAGDSASGNGGADAQEGATMSQLQGQLQANQLEIANREHSIAELQARIENYQGRLNAAPAVQQQLASLTRGYDQSQSDYDSLVKKKNESEMATSMEEMQQGERFTMLDPPSFPLKPDFPNRLKFSGIGLALGLALGIAGVLMLEFLDDRIHSEKEIKALLSMPVIAEIPIVASPAELQRSKMRMVQGWTASALVATVILVGTAFSYFQR